MHSYIANYDGDGNDDNGDDDDEDGDDNREATAPEVMLTTCDKNKQKLKQSFLYIHFLLSPIFFFSVNLAERKAKIN